MRGGPAGLAAGRRAGTCVELGQGQARASVPSWAWSGGRATDYRPTGLTTTGPLSWATIQAMVVFSRSVFRG